jgi:hypothetical protein
VLQPKAGRQLTAHFADGAKPKPVPDSIGDVEVFTICLSRISFRGAAPGRKLWELVLKFQRVMICHSTNGKLYE